MRSLTKVIKNTQASVFKADTKIGRKWQMPLAMTQAIIQAAIEGAKTAVQAM